MRSAFESQPSLMGARVIFTAIFIAGAVFVLGLQGKSFDEFAITFDVWPDRPWLFLTTNFLHADFLHVAFNLYWMWALGAQIEEQYGPLRTLGFLLLFAIAPSAAEWGFFGPGVGLSGVVYGFFGLRWALTRFHPDHRAALPTRIIEWLVAWFFICIALTYFEVMPIANVAHGVGGLIGFVTGWALSPPIRESAGYFQRASTPERWIAVALTFLVAVGAGTVGRRYVNFSPYEQARMQFEEGYSAMEREDYEAAAKSFSQAVSLYEGMGSAWFNLGLSRKRMGQWPEALEAFGEALDRRPHDEDFQAQFEYARERVERSER